MNPTFAVLIAVAVPLVVALPFFLARIEKWLEANNRGDRQEP